MDSGDYCSVCGYELSTANCLRCSQLNEAERAIIAAIRKTHDIFLMVEWHEHTNWVRMPVSNYLTVLARIVELVGILEARDTEIREMKTPPSDLPSAR